MNQSRTASLIESLCNVGSGFIVSLLLWQLVLAPMFGYEVTFKSNLQLTAVFTAVSIARSYLWRRLFVRWLDALLHRVFPNAKTTAPTPAPESAFTGLRAQIAALEKDNDDIHELAAHYREQLALMPPRGNA